MRALNRILVVLSLCSSPALATPASLPVLMGANVTEPEFRSFVRDHQRETLSEAFDAARPGLDLEDKLKRNLEQAQKNLSNQSLF